MKTETVAVVVAVAVAEQLFLCAATTTTTGTATATATGTTAFFTQRADGGQVPARLLRPCSARRGRYMFHSAVPARGGRHDHA